MSSPNVILTGARGSGKTFAAHRLGKRRSRVVYIDPTSSVKEYSYTSTSPESIAAVIRKANTFRACLWAGHIDAKSMDQALKPILSSAEAKKGDVTIIVDELGVYGDKAFLERAARLGRHTGCNFIFLSQRAVDVSQSLRAQCELFYLFQTASARDVENIKREYGKEAAAALQSLDKYHYLAISTVSGEWEVRKPFPGGQA